MTPPNAGKGRPKGSVNKRNQTVREVLERMKCNPIEAMIHILQGNVECNVCRGKLKTKYRVNDGSGHDKGKLVDRICQSCYGTGYEAVSPELRGKMAAEIAKYSYPQLKAVELSGPEGGVIPIKWVVEFAGKS